MQLVNRRLGFNLKGQKSCDPVSLTTWTQIFICSFKI